MARMFLALCPSPAEAALISATMRSFAAMLGGRPVDASDLHLTLCFLGELSARQADALREALPALKAPVVSLRLALLDWWRPSLLCLLPDAPTVPPSLQSCRGESEILARTIGVEPDARPFRPHVTAVRGVIAENAARGVPAAAERQTWPQPLHAPLDFTADRIALMRSERDASGRRYHVVATTRE